MNSLTPYLPIRQDVFVVILRYNGLIDQNRLYLEGCKSGLIGTLGKRVCRQLYRGFESLSLRHNKAITPLYDKQPGIVKKATEDLMASYANIDM